MGALCMQITASSSDDIYESPGSGWVKTQNDQGVTLVLTSGAGHEHGLSSKIPSRIADRRS
jgi:hypothetical protein